MWLWQAASKQPAASNQQSASKQVGLKGPIRTAGSDCAQILVDDTLEYDVESRLNNKSNYNSPVTPILSHSQPLPSLYTLCIYTQWSMAASCLGPLCILHRLFGFPYHIGSGARQRLCSSISHHHSHDD